MAQDAEPADPEPARPSADSRRGRVRATDRPTCPRTEPVSGDASGPEEGPPPAEPWLAPPEEGGPGTATVESMRSLQSFSVRPALPPELAPLERLAMNLRWSWDEPTRDLFRWVDKEAWEAMSHDPVRLLGQVPPERLEQLGTDPGFLRYLQEAESSLDRYLTAPRWFQTRAETVQPSPLRLVAYFSPEFGISEALPQYSGGLGVLAGDHLKASSDLGVPLVGVGLFYRSGYFSQLLAVDGMQQERFSELDPDSLALTRCDGVRVTVDLAGEPLQAQVWRADVGRVQLYLLDSDVDGNTPEGRLVTDRLYGGDTEHRIRQEILLGIGGVRALQALGLEPQVFHTNEGHAGFLGLERARQLVGQGLTFAEAVETVRAGCVFTTHTPVPAGIDRFPVELMQRYFTNFAAECGVSFDELMALGRRADEPGETRFNMAVMGLRLAARRNGVAALHGAVSRAMFAGLWPEVPTDEVPIGSVTNGVHAPTWISPELDDLLDPPGAARLGRRAGCRLGPGRRGRQRRAVAGPPAGPGAAGGLSCGSACDGPVWPRASRPATWPGPTASWTPRCSRSGFARRFATYKRATLLLSQPERLRALLLPPRAPGPVRLRRQGPPGRSAGQGDDPAHPAVRRATTRSGTGSCSSTTTTWPSPAPCTRASDVWLNTPRRPQEACGTSGMKAALNGSLNCSILDGWWDECFDGQNGWAITSAEDEPDLDRRDELEAESVFDLLESQIVPLFYDRGAGGVPVGWVSRVKHAYASLGPRVTASRMVRDYVAGATTSRPRAAADAVGWPTARPRGRALAAWRARVSAAWAGVKVGRRGGRRGAGPAGRGAGHRRDGRPRASWSRGTSPCRCSTVPSAGVTRSSSPSGSTWSRAGTDEAGRARWAGSIRCTPGRALRLHRAGPPRPRRPGHPGRARAGDLGLTAPCPARSARLPHDARVRSGPGMLDAAQIEAFRRREDAGVRAVYREYGRLVYAVSLRALGQKHLAEDATQQTFVQAWQAADRFQSDKELAPWLATIARRVAIDIHRREARRATTSLEEVSATDPAVITMPAGLEQWYEAWQVRQAIDDLPPDEREVVRLQHLEGLTHTEIAEQLGIPAGTVKSRSHRAHQRLSLALSALRGGDGTMNRTTTGVVLIDEGRHSCTLHERRTAPRAQQEQP